MFLFRLIESCIRWHADNLVAPSGGQFLMLWRATSLSYVTSQHNLCPLTHRMGDEADMQNRVAVQCQFTTLSDPNQPQSEQWVSAAVYVYPANKCLPDSCLQPWYCGVHRLYRSMWRLESSRVSSWEFTEVSWVSYYGQNMGRELSQ